LGKEDVKATILEIEALIHTFGGGVLITAFGLLQNQPERLFRSYVTEGVLFFGIALFLINFLVIKNAYNDRTGEIEMKQISKAFYYSVITMFLFFVAIFSLIFS
jgi:hypothetical protein